MDFAPIFRSSPPLFDYSIPGYGRIGIVFDGVFLTAQRDNSAKDVSNLLDAAINKGGVRFGGRAPFTSSLEPEDAAETMGKLATPELTAETRPSYWRLLSRVPGELS